MMAERSFQTPSLGEEGTAPEPNFESENPYAVLGLQRGASRRQVKHAYFRLVREHPPEEDAATFKLIRAAYEKLRTEEAKAETDLFLFQPPPPWRPRKRRRNPDLDFHADHIWKLLELHGDLGRRDFEEDYRKVGLYDE